MSLESSPSKMCHVALQIKADAFLQAVTFASKSEELPTVKVSLCSRLFFRSSRPPRTRLVCVQHLKPNSRNCRRHSAPSFRVFELLTLPDSNNYVLLFRSGAGPDEIRIWTITKGGLALAKSTLTSKALDNDALFFMCPISFLLFFFPSILQADLPLLLPPLWLLPCQRHGASEAHV